MLKNGTVGGYGLMTSKMLSTGTYHVYDHHVPLGPVPFGRHTVENTVHIMPSWQEMKPSQ